MDTVVEQSNDTAKQNLIQQWEITEGKIFFLDKGNVKTIQKIGNLAANQVVYMDYGVPLYVPSSIIRVWALQMTS